MDLKRLCPLGPLGHVIHAKIVSGAPLWDAGAGVCGIRIYHGVLDDARLVFRLAICGGLWHLIRFIKQH